MEGNPTWSMFVCGKLFICSQPKQVCKWYIISKFLQSHAMLRKVIQHYARSFKITSSCKVSHTPAWLTLLSCCDVLPVFRLFQEVGERWLSTTGGLQNLSWSFSYCFFWKQFLFPGKFENVIFSSFTQLMNVKGHGL